MMQGTCIKLRIPVITATRSVRPSMTEREMGGRARAWRTLHYLLVDTLGCAVQLGKDLVEVVRLDHELLKTFHGDFGHFSRGIAVKELRHTTGAV